MAPPEPAASQAPDPPLLSARRRWQLLLLAFTLIFVAFFMVWLPHEAAGLTFIGLEMGEEAKFLPQVRSGQILPGRSLFYLPPITLALMLALLSATWSNASWRTWAARGLAVAISLLAFPALEALGTEAAEWLWRVLMIGFVLFVVALSAFLAREPSARLARPLRIALILVALTGAIFPTWVYLAVRPAFAGLLQQEIGIGPGVWLNLAGHLLVVLLLLLAPLPRFSR